MNCIIVDDEPLARSEMRSLITETSNVDILGEFSNAPSALDFLKDIDVDLIFLDIEMPMVTGLEFAEMLPKKSLIIFTTAYSQYALRSYELEAVDYLLKPVDPKRLEKAIDKAILYTELLSKDTVKNTVESNTADFLFIKAERRFYKISFADIKFIEGLKDYVVIHTKQQKLITAMNLKTIHQKISGETFIRVSKSYIVNMNYIDSFDNHNIYIEDSEIPLGEVYRSEFFTKFAGGLLNSD
ncbi:LytTR family DNA-binding domain-containing protein [Chryseobacterium sp. D764]|jgi:DNA-binding LytR/AlgR family response regulator|uniref:LytR/AlgR family response regulator transcription factor n=1 Tax=unclassified Chryseobacterium TaxID=2593645 RepID=UPI0015C2088B|nr:MULTISPECIES: LytTR family DNA-binding domain-containing protein [unclassified Chryseobacterium]QXU50612.1 LytTR family DNA-binding domain-containing protein [Chryseobacterium sp. D764]CAD0219221.1 DNA-binding response regulator [Chryseobacterium sp. JV274]